MMRKVLTSRRVRRSDIARFLDGEQQRALAGLSKALQGKKVVHANATAKGGGVAEMLQSFVPYLNAYGLRGQWYAIRAEEAGKRFFFVTDKMRYALHGQATEISEAEWRLYESVNRRIAADLDEIDCDVLVIHDWQLLFSALHFQKRKPQIYVSHPDTSAASQPLWKRLAPAMEAFRFVMFSNKAFVRDSIAQEKVKIIAPVIDPLALKQKIVSPAAARQYLARFGIPETGSLIVQVSRFDPMKNPWGVIEAFMLVRKKYPQCHLALVGLEEASDNPAARELYEGIKAAVGQDSHISLFFDADAIKNIAEFTMMAQNAADVIVQNSTREGFGLVVTEAMWKKKPVVGGPAEGIKRQIQNGKNGYIAKNSRELARHIDYLLSHGAERKRIGKAARESVRKNFLMPRLLLDHLMVYNKVIGDNGNA